MKQWPKIEEELHCLYKWHPIKRSVRLLHDEIIKLQKTGYPEPSDVLVDNLDGLALVWEFGVIYVKLTISLGGKNLKIYFDTNLILEKKWQ